MSHLVSAQQGLDVGLGMIRKIVSSSTHGGLSIAHAELPFGTFIPPHVHTREDESTYVVDGEVQFLIGDEHIVAQAGAWVLKPRHVSHCFWTAGRASVIEVITPGTLDEYFRELAHLRSRAEIDAHQARYGITFDYDLEREVRARFGLTGGTGLA